MYLPKSSSGRRRAVSAVRGANACEHLAEEGPKGPSRRTAERKSPRAAHHRPSFETQRGAREHRDAPQGMRAEDWRGRANVTGRAVRAARLRTFADQNRWRASLEEPQAKLNGFQESRAGCVGRVVFGAGFLATFFGAASPAFSGSEVDPATLPDAGGFGTTRGGSPGWKRCEIAGSVRCTMVSGGGSATRLFATEGATSQLKATARTT